MNKKLFFAILTSALLLLLSISTFAAETSVSVGTGKQYTTLDAAISALGGEGGQITVYGTVTVSTALTIPEQSGDLTITASGNGALKITAASLTFEKNTNSNVITLDLPLTTADSGLLLFGGFNSIVFGENFNVSGKVNFYGGVDAEKGLSISTTAYVEEHAESNRKAITALPYSITVKNGNFGVFAGGNRRSAKECIYGSIAAKLDVIIDGGTFSSPVTYGVNDALKLDSAFSLSGQSILADDATLTINGGTFDTPIYVNAFIGTNYTTASAASQVTNSSADYYATDGDIVITINGGTFTENCFEISAEQTAASFNRLLRGNYTLSIGENASLTDKTVLDATQVKAYNGQNKVATLAYANSAALTAKNFDSVSGTVQNECAEPTRIACIGDSITQGTGAGDMDRYSYPAHLYTKLAGEGSDVIVSNYGCGGTKVTCFQGMYYKDGLAYTISVEETDPDTVFLCLGINDRGIVGNTVGPRKLFCDEYAALLTSYTSLESTENVYAVTPLYVYEYGVEVGQIVRHLQKTTVANLTAAGNDELSVIDMYQLVWKECLNGQKNGEMLGSDGLHPHADGYKIFMNAIYGAVFADEKIAEKPLPKRSDIYIDQTNGKVDGAGTKEDPIKHLTIAYEMADRDADVVTIHFVGTYTDDNLTSSTPSNNTPLDLKKIRYVGETDANGNAGKWLLSSKYFLINCDTEFDNITVKYSGNTALYYYGGFNSVKFGEGFNTENHRYAIFVAGHNVYSDLGGVNDVRFTSAQSVSSDKDITVELLGGKFFYVIAGNRHYNSSANAGLAPYGTYSGNMIFTVGENVFISNDSDEESAICGMNYLTGTIVANINSWGEGIDIREYSAITKKSALAADYNETYNTGKVTINLGENVKNNVIISGDINGDGKVDIADSMTLLQYIANGIPATYNAKCFYDRTSISLIHVMRSLTVATN